MIEPQTEKIVTGVVHRLRKDVDYMFEPSNVLNKRYGIIAASSICNINENKIPIRISNLTNENIWIYPGVRLGTIAALKGKNEQVRYEKEVTRTIDLSNTDLKEEQKEQLQQLLNEYSEVIAQDEFDIGRTKIVKHTIPLLDERPIKQRAYRIPYTQEEEVQKKVKEMADNEIIRRSASPWTSPVVMVKKKDGSIRFCVDYRKLNEVTRKDTYPLPRIDEMLDKLGRSTIFTTLDLQSGYWQIEVEEEDKQKTAFSTGKDLWEFNVLPFGLTGAPATFQRCMNYILMDTDHTMVYIDDIIIYSRTFSEHLQDVRNVFERLKQSGLKVKPSKCEFAKTSVKFLGHIITADGIKPDPTNTDKVRNITAPSTVKEIQQFIGLASYYRKFIKGFAGIASPLHELVHKDKEFKWTERQ